mmetsp:Transcript_39883/g.76454  ORF Transcript_39883/g.76454 Transcript_39883/m.76454 type:complete len:243 (-) Transcript_39883:756-1484(-)
MHARILRSWKALPSKKPSLVFAFEAAPRLKVTGRFDMSVIILLLFNCITAGSGWITRVQGTAIAQSNMYGHWANFLKQNWFAWAAVHRAPLNSATFPRIGCLGECAQKPPMSSCHVHKALIGDWCPATQASGSFKVSVHKSTKRNHRDVVPCMTSFVARCVKLWNCDVICGQCARVTIAQLDARPRPGIQKERIDGNAFAKSVRNCFRRLMKGNLWYSGRLSGPAYHGPKEIAVITRATPQP